MDLLFGKGWLNMELTALSISDIQLSCTIIFISRSDGKKGKPLVTALVETEEEAINSLKTLSERLNAN